MWRQITAGDFGSGLAVGIGCGMAIGMMSIGMGSGLASSKKKTKRQLAKAISDKTISIVSSDGKELSPEKLFDLLEKDYRKV
jgi:hypothetical protein